MYTVRPGVTGGMPLAACRSVARGGRSSPGCSEKQRRATAGREGVTLA